MNSAVIQTWLQAQSGSQLAGSLYFLGAAPEVTEEEASGLRSLAVSAYEARAQDRAAFQTRVADTLSRVASRFAPSEKITGQVQSSLLGALSFEDLQRQLRDRVAQLDLDGAVKLFFAGGILSRQVSRHLVTELRQSRHKSTDLFLRRLIRLVTDPEMSSYSDLHLRKNDPHDQAILKVTEKALWRITDLFGRLTILTQGEAEAAAQGRLDEILSPNLSWKLEEVVTVEGEEELPAPAYLPPVSEVSTKGALMVLHSSPTKQEMKIASYPLLRRAIFSLMAAERFQDAAEMLMTLREPEILAKLFQDLQMLEGRRENGFANASAFYRDTAGFAGLTLAAMPVSESAHLLEVVVREGMNGPWLVRAMASVRPDQLSGLFSPGDELPILSTLLGSLVENRVTRVRMHSILALALDPDADHQKEAVFYEALDRLHERYPAFAQPQRMIAENFAEVFDEKLAARGAKKVEPSGGILGEAFGRFRRQTVLTRYLELPELNLATRQEVMNRLKERLRLFFREDWVSDKKWPVFASQVLLTLQPSEVWRLLDFQKSDVGLSRPEILAHLLLTQEADVAAAFFTAWGREVSESVEEGKNTLGRVLATLWKNGGEKGERLVTEAVREALKSSEATAVFQKILSEHGSDGALMLAQMEMYQELTGAAYLGGEINPYDVFVTTGVLRPGDLEGKFRKEAIKRALKILNDVEHYGQVEVPTRILDDHTAVVIADDPFSGTPLSKEEQQAWRCRAVEVLVKLEADEPAVVKYFAARLADEANEAFHILDRLGPRGKIRLIEYLIQYREHIHDRYVESRLSPGRPYERVIKSRQITQKPSLRRLIKSFGFNSRAMQAYIWKQILKTDGPYVKEFKKHGHIDRIAVGEVETPEIIQELAGLGDAALILLEPFANGDAGILIKREKRYSSAAAGVAGSEEWQEFYPIFIPLLHLAELIGTPAAHQILVDLYEVVSKHTETEIRGSYFSREYPIPQTPLSLIVRALVRMEYKAGYSGPVAVEVHADFISRYVQRDPVEVTLSVVALQMVGDINFVAKKIAEVWEKNDSSAWGLIRALHDNGPLLDSVLGYITSPFLYWELLGKMGKPMNIPVSDIVRKTALDEDPTNHQRAIAIKTLFWNFRGIRMNLALQPMPAPDPALKTLYDSGLAARYADPEDLAYFESKLPKFFGLPRK